MSSIGDVRPSQVITTFGPGAIVDLQTLSIIVAGIDNWHLEEENMIREPRLERVLGVTKFYAPPPAEGDPPYRKGSVPSFVFPRYQHCPTCRTLSEFKGSQSTDLEYNERDQEILCNVPGCFGRGAGPRRRKAHTVPAQFIVACPSGHLNDFPWRRYVHRGDTTCKERIKLNTSARTGSVADLYLKCNCSETRSMSDAFGENANENLGNCSKKRPWLGINDFDRSCENQNKLRALQRGATNAWFPIIKSVLAIKEAADPIQRALRQCNENQIKNIKDEELLGTMINNNMFPLLEEFSVEEVWQAIRVMRGDQPPPDEDLKWPEWEVLKNPDVARKSREFHIEEGVVPSIAEGLIKKIVLAKRLLEVKALTGFTRIDYVTGEPDDGDFDATIAKIYKNKPNWLPAVEIRGEGIFIEFSEEAINEWENNQNVSNRTNEIKQMHIAWERQRNPEREPQFPGARYVLIHTLAHALILQFSLDCGYPATSLRERIYCSEDPEKKMAGVLIYTAGADSEGSLGGLVDLGSSEEFPKLLKKALKNLTRCSSDPVCADHQPDIHATINGAACHACSYVAETSCELFNRFLDRSFVVPTINSGDMAFFRDVRNF